MDKKPKVIIFYIVLFLFIITVNSILSAYDFDLWARLILGKYVVQTGHLPVNDFLSYTMTHPWMDHEWGASVIFYLVQHFGGSTGLILLQSTIIFAIFFVITRIVAIRGVKTTTPYNIFYYILALNSIDYIFKNPIRCQIFSFLLFAIFLLILELYRKEKIKDIALIISLPALMILWVNLHGGCVIGLGLIAIYIIGELLNRKPIKNVIPYLYALILSVAVLPINPWGFKYVPFLFKSITMSRYMITEWAPLYKTDFVPAFVMFAVLTSILLLVEAGFAVKSIMEKKIDFDKTKFLVLFITFMSGVMHVKLVVFFVITAASFLYDDFYTAFNFVTRNVFNKRWMMICKEAVVYGIVLTFIMVNLKTDRLDSRVYFNRYPILSVEFIKINDIKGNLLTPFEQGSYAAYKLFPNNRVFMDGRYEAVYPSFTLPILMNFFSVTPDWENTIKIFPPNVMIINKKVAVYKILKKHKDWALVYEKDKDFGVFVRKQDLKKQYKMPSTKYSYYKKRLFDTDVTFRDEQWQQNQNR